MKRTVSKFEFGREIVLKALTGSHNYNLNTPTSDEDFKFFVMPSFEDLYRANFFSLGKHSVELDFTVHDIRKLTSLIWKSNINFIEVLFSVREEHDPDLNFLFENRERLVAGNLPYFRDATYGMHLEKLHTLHKGTEKTQPIVNELGYDTKDACHALRCLYTLEKYWQTESMQKALWYNKGKKRTILLDVKAGKYSEEEFMALVDEWHHKKWNGEMKKNYADTQADLGIKAELDNFMYDYVKKKMLAK